MIEASYADNMLATLHKRLLAIAADRSAARLRDQLSAGSWIYGAGNYGRRLARLLEAASFPCLGFIDRRGDSKREVDGLPVFAPDKFSREQAQGRCFVLGIFNPALDADEILPFSEALPFKHRLWNADLPEALGEEANTIWLASRTYFLENFSEFETVARSLNDAASVDTYLALILFRFTGRRADYPSWDLPTQYLPPDLPGFSHPIVFVDGGAYTGDTLTMLIKSGVDVSDWLAFEPDDANFEKLARTARSSGIRSSLFPCGLSDRLHQARFENNLGVGSRLTEDATANATVIQCVALDDVIQNVAPNFVKLDVEGAEIAALDGMARTIDAYRPRLAISSYHKPEDIWAIPQKLRALLPDATLHIRQHAINGLDTVTYAIPR